jgi:hypothetical protein
MSGTLSGAFRFGSNRLEDIVLLYDPEVMGPTIFVKRCCAYLSKNEDRKKVMETVKNFGGKYPLKVVIMQGKDGGYLRGGAVQIDRAEYEKCRIIKDMTGLCLDFGIEHDDFYKIFRKTPYKELVLLKEKFESNLKSCVRNICESGQAPFTTLKVEPAVKGPGLLVLPLEITEPTDPVLSLARDSLYRDLFRKL